MRNALQNSLKGTKQNSLFKASVVGGLGTVSAALFAHDPVLVFALAVAVGIASLLILRPAFALKVVLLSGAVPLEWLGSTNPGEKPLIRALGGTSVDGLRLVILSAALALLLLNSGSLHVPKDFRWYLIFVGFLTLSLTYSGARLEGLRLVVKVVYPVLIFFATSRFITTPQQVDSALKYWIAGGLLSTVIGLVTYLRHGSTAFEISQDFRYSSGLVYASPFSMYMLALFTLCYAVWRTTLKKHYAVLALLFGLQAMMTQTRITWASLLISMLILETSVERRPGRLRRASLVVALLTFILGYLVWLSPAIQRRFLYTEFSSAASALDAVQQLNLSGRELVWARVYENYELHNPWVGQGAGTSGAFLAHVLSEVRVPHNEYLRLLHDTGLIGLGLFCVGILGLFRFLQALRKGLPSLRQRLLTICGLALLGGYVVEAITDNPLDYYWVYSQYVFFVLGLAWAEHTSLQLVAGTRVQHGASGAAERVTGTLAVATLHAQCR